MCAMPRVTLVTEPTAGKLEDRRVPRRDSAGETGCGGGTAGLHDGENQGLGEGLTGWPS